MNILRFIANGGALLLAKREMTDETTRGPLIQPSVLRSIGAVMGIGAFLTFTNPFGATSELPTWASYLYWTLLVGEGWLGGPFIAQTLGRLAPRLPEQMRFIFAIALVAVLISATIAVVQWATGEPVPTWYLPTLYTLVLGISVGVATISWLVDRAFAGGPGAVTHAPAGGSATGSVRFMERLPPKLRGAVIYAISSEDHYLRLHTSKGADLILMRLSDAIVELEGLEGAQTHRSWWVARDAVESTRRDGDRVTLMLKGSVEAPVSRPNIKPLREAGWF